MINVMLKIRIGIILIVISWLPIAQTVLYIAHSNGNLTNDLQSQKFRLTVWAVQIIIGWIGLWMIGAVAFKLAKQSGWKKTPAKFWQLFLHGHNEQPGD